MFTTPPLSVLSISAFSKCLERLHRPPQPVPSLSLHLLPESRRVDDAHLVTLDHGLGDRQPDELGDSGLLEEEDGVFHEDVGAEGEVESEGVVADEGGSGVGGGSGPLGAPGCPLGLPAGVQELGDAFRGEADGGESGEVGRRS